MYHQTILHLDAAAQDFHDRGMMSEKNAALKLGGIYQQTLLAASPYPPNRRYLSAQWCWALGHIGLLYQLIRWFRLHEPDTKLSLLANTAANPHFLRELLPFLSQDEMPVSPHEAMTNAVYFGCPDGRNSLVRFYKIVEAECRDIHLLELDTTQRLEAEAMLEKLGVRRPFVALQARASQHDAKRNVTQEQISEALLPYLASGYSVVSTGLDPKPMEFPSVLSLPDPQRASFLLSASCDKFIGSNSGAWTMAHAYRRPVEIINDYERAAWIYD